MNLKKMAALAGVLLVGGCTSSEPQWAQRNQRVIEEFNKTYKPKK